MQSLAPVDRAERISSIDVLRGVALLGILLMNIQDFGLPGRAYWDPNAWGGTGGADLAYWFANQIFFEGKMRTIFSMLFGAGFLVLASRAEARGLEAQVGLADIYYRRTMWLMFFGFLHAFFIWNGDILLPYAFIGLFLFPLRKLAAKTLMRAGGIIILIAIAFNGHQEYEQLQIRQNGEAALALEKQGKKLTKEQAEAKKKWEERKKELLPDPKKIQKNINDHRLGYWANFERRTENTNGQLGGLFTWAPFDIACMMLIGMGLMKLGVFTAQLPTGFYVRLMLFGYGLGVTINGLVAWGSWRMNWDPLIFYPWPELTYEIGRLSVALGHTGLVMIICQKGWLGFLTRRLQAVGQTALTNYLATSLLCTFFFNGYGLGMFGHLGRHQLLYVVATVWTLNLVISPIWLKHFRFGPMEWVWRSLTYWEKQPMRVNPPSSKEDTPLAAHA